MLSSERIAELRAININSVSPFDFLLLCEQAEYAVQLEAKVKRLEAEVTDTEITEE